jgi:membrane protease YdiL (CAAX protease family)
VTQEPFEAGRTADTPDARLLPQFPQPAPSPGPAVPWTLRDVWIGLGLLVLWFVLAMGGVLLVSFLDLPLDVGLVITLLEAFLFLPAWWLTVRKYKVGLDVLGLRRFRAVMLLLAAGLLAVAYTFNLFYALILVLLGVEPSLDLINLVSELEHPWLLALGAVVVAPLAEEIFFRGFLFAGLRERYGWVKAALISAAAFSLLHLQPVQALPIFVLGFFFALLYEKSRSLWPAIAMHATINAIGLAAAYFVSRMGLSPGG